MSGIEVQSHVRPTLTAPLPILNFASFRTQNGSHCLLRVHFLCSQRSDIAAVLRGVHFGQAEVENLGMPALSYEEVRRLDIAMDDSFSGARCGKISV